MHADIVTHRAAAQGILRSVKYNILQRPELTPSNELLINFLNQENKNKIASRKKLELSANQAETLLERAIKAGYCHQVVKNAAHTPGIPKEVISFLEGLDAMNLERDVHAQTARELSRLPKILKNPELGNRQPVLSLRAGNPANVSMSLSGQTARLGASIQQSNLMLSTLERLVAQGVDPSRGIEDVITSPGLFDNSTRLLLNELKSALQSSSLQTVVGDLSRELSRNQLLLDLITKKNETVSDWTARLHQT